MWCFRVVKATFNGSPPAFGFLPALHKDGKVEEVRLSMEFSADSPLDLEQMLQDMAEALALPTLEWDGNGSWTETPSYMEMSPLK